MPKHDYSQMPNPVQFRIEDEDGNLDGTCFVSEITHVASIALARHHYGEDYIPQGAEDEYDCGEDADGWGEAAWAVVRSLIKAGVIYWDAEVTALNYPS